MNLEELIKNKILFFGFEFGNCYGTYSDLDSSTNIAKEQTSLASLNNKVLKIKEKRLLKNNKIERNLIFTPKSTINLYDMVSRFIIHTNCSKPAMINNTLVDHKQSEKYYQYPVREAFIPINEKYSLKFENINYNINKNFDDVIYIRDAKQKETSKKIWILHHRLISNYDKDLKIILCTRFFNGKINMIDKIFPKYIKKKLFRIRETNYQNSPIMSLKETKLDKHHSHHLNTTIEICNERYY